MEKGQNFKLTKTYVVFLTPLHKAGLMRNLTYVEKNVSMNIAEEVQS